MLINETNFNTFIKEYGLVNEDGWYKIPDIPVFFVFDENVNSVIIDGEIPLVIALEMFDKLAHHPQPPFSNTLCGSRMDPVMLAIDSWMKRDGLTSKSVNDYAIFCNVFLSLSDEHYIDYTTIECLNVLTWFASNLIYYQNAKDEGMESKGLY